MPLPASGSIYTKVTEVTQVPKTLNQWLMFTLAVFVAGVVINTIVRRIPQLAQISEGV